MEDISDAVLQFRSAGYLEDATPADPLTLTVREQERYDRSRLLFRWMDTSSRASSWEPQELLRNASVVVLGLGGTGGAVAMALAGSGVGSIHLVDADVVELSNLNRQAMYTEDDIGSSKVAVSVERLQRMNSDITVTGVQAHIACEDDLLALVASCDVFMLCADEPGEIRAWVNHVALEVGTPWVDAGYHGPLVAAAAFVPGHGACYECGWLLEHEEKSVDLVNAAPYSPGRGGHKAVSAPSAGLSGYLAAHLCIGLITGIPSVKPGQLQGFNLFDADQHYVIPARRHPQCPACKGRS